MTRRSADRQGPLVSLIIPTFNRREFLREAVASAVAQDYPNLQIIVANDGGEPVDDIISAVGDGRITLLQRAENRGKAVTLNEALARADGEYVAYLDDDDIHYPHHISSLVSALAGDTDCQVAYTNLYRTTFRTGADGRRIALGKVLEVRRDFDRYFMFNFNHVLHCSLMHRRDLLDKTGPYNPQVKVLIDWDITRRLAFFSDFLHVDRITGEYTIPEHKSSDRISFRMRQDTDQFRRTLLTIRTTRPAKPWPKVADLSIIVAAGSVDQALVAAITRMVQRTFWPFRVYVAAPAGELERLAAAKLGDAVAAVPIPAHAPAGAVLDRALAACEGDVVAVVPPTVQAGEMWIEWPIHPLLTDPHLTDAMAIPAAGGRWAVAARKQVFLDARAAWPALGPRQCLTRAGVAVRTPDENDSPLMLDKLLSAAKELQAEGDWRTAGQIMERLPSVCRNELWLTEQTAEALFNAGGSDEQAIELCRHVNSHQPTVNSLLLEGRLLRRMGQPAQAAEVLEQAREVLQWQA